MYIFSNVFSLQTNFTSIMEDLLAALDNKNPSIKDETCKFLTRVFIGSTPATLPKAVLKQIAPAVVKVSIKKALRN